MKIGKTKNSGQLEGCAEYVRIERDAVTIFTDADRHDGSRTNFKGFKLSATYQLIKNMALGVNYLSFKDIIGLDDTHQRIQADVAMKF